MIVVYLGTCDDYCSFIVMIGLVKGFATKFVEISLFGFVIAFMVSCGDKIQTPEDTKFLEEFHLANYEQPVTLLQEGRRNLFVDYSTCCSLGQNSRFFQEVSASFANSATLYYAIRGAEVTRMEGDVYTLLRNIDEVSYAELAMVADSMAQSDIESVLLTDGEYFTQNIAKGHVNDPYLATAFKTWILKGHDIHIISEPYTETNKGMEYEKKRFYIIFTDDRMPNNIYSRIRGTVDFTKYPEVDDFHISTSHPFLKGSGKSNASFQNEILQSKAKGYGTFEIEDWEGCDWKTIEEMVVNGVSESTGEPLPNGDFVAKLNLDKNSFGCYKINSLNIRAYDINQAYNDFYVAKMENPKSNPPLAGAVCEIDSLFVVDSGEFEKHSIVAIHFNQGWFNPAVLSGSPYNYIKVDLSIGSVQEIFSSHEEKFMFDDISQPGNKNVSVASSIKQCLADYDVQKMMQNQVIYSIYVKCEGN